MLDMLNIATLPKVELHIHIEGTFEPELALVIAKRNGIQLKYSTAAELKDAYNFNNLQDFLDIYYENASVLIHEIDFYDLAYAYFEKASSQGVRRAEIFFDPQTHTQRGVSFETVITGLNRAAIDAKKNFGLSSGLIMCFLRHLPAVSAIDTLKAALPFKDLILAVGLDSSEKNFPPSIFKEVYEMAVKEGFRTVAHAGEEGPAEYIWEAIKLLKVERIDHGNHALDDPKLIDYLVKNKIPLTICPLSNIKLKVIKDMKDHPLKKMLDLGLLVSINSDDPAYFGGYILENYISVADALGLSEKDLITLAKNSFLSAFISDSEKAEFIALLP
jgi:adenosine deaminase